MSCGISYGDPGLELGKGDVRLQPAEDVMPMLLAVYVPTICTGMPSGSRT